MPSKPLTRLISRLDAVSAHLELVDAALEAIDLSAARATNSKTLLVEAIGLKASTRKRLTLKARDHRGATNHARARNAEHTVQLLYTHFTTYLRGILKVMYEAKPLHIVEKAQGQLKYHEIVRLGSYEAVCNAMVDQVFRSLESQKSTAGLLEKILDRTGVSIKEAILEQGLLYLEIRHLVVHNSGYVDEKFVQRFGSRMPDAKVGRRLASSIGSARTAIHAVTVLCEAIDRGLFESGYLNDEQQADRKDSVLEVGDIST